MLQAGFHKYFSDSLLNYSDGHHSAIVLFDHIGRKEMLNVAAAMAALSCFN